MGGVCRRPHYPHSRYGFNAYTLAGRLKSVTDPQAHVTTTSTDFAGRITSLTPPAGAAKTFAYDGSGNLVRIVQGEATTQLGYDSRDRLTTVIDPEGNSTGYSYDATGCSIGCGASNDIPKSITDPFAAVTENLFDRTGKVTDVIDPLGHLTSLSLDQNGRVASRRDANGKTTTYAYDGLGRVTRQLDASGGITAFTYDQRGNLLTLSDPKGQTTTFTYDKAGRKTKETRPEGEQTSYTYYANGLLQTVKDAKNQTTTYRYDDAGRLSEVLYADNQKDSFAYDQSGNLTSYANAQVSGTMTYDPAGRKSSEAVTLSGITKSYSYSYDPQGNKASYTSPEGIIHSYRHDKAGKLTEIKFDNQIISLNYDKTRLKEVTLPNGVSSTYAYNAASWLTGITVTGPNATLLSRGYSFDSVGNISGQTSEHGATGYGYDDLYQLTSADHPETIPQSDEAYSYDKVGNRASSAATTGSWSYNKNNELQSSVTTSYEYDTNGNTIKKTGTGSDEAVPVPLTTLYHYDASNRLTEVTLPDGTTASYTYDPFGRRVKKTLSTQTTLYSYADEGLIGEYDASGTVQTVYGWKPDGLWGTDPLYLKQNGVLAFYHNDHLGTPQKLTDGQGSVVWSATYAAFGLAVVDAESTVVNNLRFPGQYFDTETGKNYNYFRYYDFTTGRYDKIDPIGFLGGINTYRYAVGNPYGYIDPFGLETFGIGIESPVSSAVVNGVLNPSEDTGHTFAYLMDANGKVTNVLSVGPSSPIGAFNKNSFLNGTLGAVSNWPLAGQVHTYEWNMTPQKYIECELFLKQMKQNPGNYSPTNQCTSSAIGLAKKCGVNIPDGISSINVPPIKPIFSGYTNNLPNPYGLQQQLNKTMTPIVIPASKIKVR